MRRVFTNFMLSILVLGVSAASAAEVSGRFNGMITPSGCRSSQKSAFNGTIMDGRVKGIAAYGRSFDWALEADGTFGGELFLRKHRRGDKMQMYKGKVVGAVVIVKAEFGVPGYSQTFCTGAGEFPLNN